VEGGVDPDQLAVEEEVDLKWDVVVPDHTDVAVAAPLLANHQ
jgi:hypothetical protein